ncbi:hypothetical protein M413DRAFT_449034 [Hebeloma cylindrosporum]|uniref:Uncharacterized protein n=1 Tax=Hebeloma cylindrosporum TaxID=76867 RepID=A0A0C3BZ30_HEBCY|nr:hypothetical protein M413DRAFT_449034 [Hebeloma cylindrosporum h7]
MIYIRWDGPSIQYWATKIKLVQGRHRALVASRATFGEICSDFSTVAAMSRHDRQDREVRGKYFRDGPQASKRQ